jgi:hypothetical protein
MVAAEVLPDEDHVARTCKKSSLANGAPSPASFEFRLGGLEWTDAYLSVNWLEYLLTGNASLTDKVGALREYQLDNPCNLAIVKPTASNVYAVLPVGAIHSATLAVNATTLACSHEPNSNFDPHAGIAPTPGVNTWPADSNGAAHLAVQQMLFQAVKHWEPGKPTK